MTVVGWMPVVFFFMFAFVERCTAVLAQLASALLLYGSPLSSVILASVCVGADQSEQTGGLKLFRRGGGSKRQELKQSISDKG